MSATLTFDYDSPLGDSGTRRLELGPTGPAGVGVPAGGTTGQVLAKSSGTDYATGWASLSITSADITDSTATGRAVLTAADAAAARSAIGAGTGNGNALTSGTLAQFAATTSAELAGVLTDETGSGGGFVRATSPTLSGVTLTGTTTVSAINSAGNLTLSAAAGPTFTVRTDNTFDVANTGTYTCGQRLALGSGGLNLVSGSVVTFASSSTQYFTGIVLGLARLDDNTVEVNNGTRTASGGALRGLSVSTLTASGTLTVTNGLTASSGETIISTAGSQTARFIRVGSGAWADSAAGSFLQLGLATGNQNALITGGNGNAFGRLGLVGGVTQISSGTNFANLPVPTAGRIVEFVNSGAVVASLSTAGGATFNGVVNLGTYTVATLPSAGANAGAFAQVTDSNSTTNGNIVAGGGANRVPVFSNGTNWVIK